MDTKFTFISSSCIGQQFFQHSDSPEYTNPLISSLVVDDFQFVKLCKNLDKYLKVTPRFGEPSKHVLSGHVRVVNGVSTPNYPVMFLDDIEIHWLHHKSEQEVMSRWGRRKQRYFANPKLKNMFILPYSHFFVDHTPERVNELLKEFFSCNGHCIFLGPPKLLTDEIKSLLTSEKHFIEVPVWDNIPLYRNPITYHFNDLYQIQTDIKNYLKQIPGYEFAFISF